MQMQALQSICTKRLRVPNKIELFYFHLVASAKLIIKTTCKYGKTVSCSLLQCLAFPCFPPSYE